MKRKKRLSVFETNSSSVHTVVVKYDGQFVMELERDAQRPHAVVGHCSDYSEVGHDADYIISTQQGKFDYLVSWIACKRNYGYDYGFEDMWEYKSLLYALQLVDPGICEIVVKDSENAEFDHQTSPCNRDCIVDFYDEHAICNFIFNDNITVRCNFD